ncbi:MAG: tryptophan 7-halogenase [Alteromonadaceae bacterium]|nr:tryptophan 7-halogenase [Alteromonadaceae bacterium]
MNKQKIVIVGGGTSGWMAANMLAHQLADVASVTVVDSSGIAPVGVGEGSTPFFKQFFDELGIAEQEWMPACHATYKNGIVFPGWNEQTERAEYFHPFYNEADTDQVNVFFAACAARLKGYECCAHPDDFFIASHLQALNKAPTGSKPVVDYGYHFDAGLLAEFLRKLALSKSVAHIDDRVIDVKCAHNGGITSIVTDNHAEIAGDLFIDCTGFRGLLIRKTLGRAFISYSDRLLCNAAVALPLDKQMSAPGKDGLASATVSAAVEQGWIWNIPLTHRTGTGLVYCSDMCSQQQALEALASYHGINLKELEEQNAPSPKHLSWHPGRLEEHWYKNCVAIGLSQGFIEPLEAPMLNLTQQSIGLLIAKLKSHEESAQVDFNQQVNGMYDGTCDYIQAHYLLNSRQQGLFWQKVRNNMYVPDSLQALIGNWQQGKAIDPVLAANPQQQIYLKTSWYCLLAGLAQFPEVTQQMPARSQRIIEQAKHRAASIASEFPDQQKVLTQFANNARASEQVTA